MIDLPPPKFWLPSKPAIIRHAPDLPKAILPGFIPMYSPRSPVDLTYVGVATPESATKSVYTATGAPLGPSLPNRRVLVCAASTATATGNNATAMTINGVSATRLGAIESINNAGVAYVSIWQALLGNNGATSGDIVTTYASNMARNYLSTYYTTTWRGNVSQVVTDNDGSTGGGGLTASISCLSLGAVLAGVSIAINAGVGTTTWTGLTKDTDVQVVPPSAARYHGTAHANFNTAQNPLAVAMAYTGMATSAVACMLTLTLSPN